MSNLSGPELTREIIAYRNRLGVSETEFSRASGISPQTICSLTLNNDGEVGGLDLVVDYFRAWKADGSGGVPFLAWQNDKLTLASDVEIDGDLNVKNGSITADQIVANGVTKTYENANSGNVTLGSMADIVSIDITMDRPGTLILMSCYQFTFSGSSLWTAEIAVGDTSLQTGRGTSDHYASFMRSFTVTAPGIFTARARASSTGGVSINAGGCSLVVLRTYT